MAPDNQGPQQLNREANYNSCPLPRQCSFSNKHSIFYNSFPLILAFLSYCFPKKIALSRRDRLGGELVSESVNGVRLLHQSDKGFCEKPIKLPLITFIKWMVIYSNHIFAQIVLQDL